MNVASSGRTPPFLLGRFVPDQQGERRQTYERPANHGNVWLRAIMGEVVWASIRTKASYFYAQYHRLARHRGKEKAAFAVAHSLLVVIYHVLRTGQPYKELGVDYFDNLDSARIERHHVRRLEQLGFTVTLTPTAA